MTALLSGDSLVARADSPLPALALVNVTDILGDMRGGLKRAARVLNKTDLTASYAGGDGESPDYSAFVDLQITDATGLTETVVGNFLAVSSIDAPAGLRLANAWVARDFHGQGGLKFGILDLNTEFDVQTTAALFLNSAFGIGPDFSQTGDNGPSIFPSTGLGLVGWWLPGGHWQLKGGLFQGVPGDPAHPGRSHISLMGDDGALLVGEVRNHLTPDFVVGLGAWHYTKSFDAIESGAGRLTGNSGFYAIADGKLYAAPEGENAGLAGWARAGFADARINPVAFSISGGFVYTAPFGQMADQAGIAFGRVQYGGPARREALANGAPLQSAETMLETTYSLSLNSHLALQPDLQYVMAPGGNPALADAIIFGSRLTASW